MRPKFAPVVLVDGCLATPPQGRGQLLTSSFSSCGDENDAGDGDDDDDDDHDGDDDDDDA